MAAKVKIVTDSTAYLLPEIIKKYDVYVVPLRVAFGAKVYSEGVDITNDEFYRKLRESDIFPTTSQPPVDDFARVYSKLAKLGHPILSIHIPSKLSGTIGSAQTARKALPQAQIEIVDSLSVAMGMLVPPAARAADEGQTLTEIKASIETLNRRIQVIGAFNTLHYLWKGGRIGAARALVGTLLKIKPVLTSQDGEVKVLTKPRTMARAIEYIAKFIANQIGRDARLHGWLGHSHAPEGASALENELRGRFNWVELRLLELGPVLGTHMGPGFIGLGFYSEEALPA